MLYLHGGAYVQNFNSFHWSFLARLVQYTGCQITAPDYPFAPKYTFKDALGMVTDLYGQILSKTDPNDIILMGDSAGGGFALGLAQFIRDENINPPHRIVLLSPWLDISLTNPDIGTIEPVDHFLDKQSLIKAGRLYAGDIDPSCHLLSPVYGSLHSLGKISIFIGSRDMLVADTRKLKGHAESNGVEIDYHEYEGMTHAWMFLDFPESKKARQEIFELVR